MQIITTPLAHQLVAVLVVVAGLLITPIVFIALDLWAGIRKARQRGEPISSDKLQRTTRKLSRYYNALLALLMIDVVQITSFVFLHTFNGWSAFTFPLFTLLGVLFVAVIEVKSIFEPATLKESRELKEVAELAKAIAAHKSDAKEIAEAISEFIIKSKEKNENN